MKRISSILKLLCVLSTCNLGACKSHPREMVTTYPGMTAANVLEHLRSRSAQIKAISCQGTIRLSGSDGQSVILDTAIALKPTENLARIRAWKFCQAVFDLTLLEDGVYLVAPSDSSQRAQIVQGGSNAGQMIREWLRLISTAPDARQCIERGNELIFLQSTDSGMTLLTVVDRLTITPRQYRLLDSHGHEQFSLTLSDYVESNGNVWPRRIEAISSEGTVRLNFDEVEINTEIPSTAFKPPARAEKLP